MLYEQVYWDVPPWIRWRTIMTVDREVGLWLKPNVSRSYVNLFGPISDLADVEPVLTGFLPSTPDWLRKRPAWTLATNSRGVRDDEIPVPKDAGAFRIVVLGDSWTVGTNVDVDETYPRQLATVLRARFPGRKIEVVNYGSIGAGVETGRKLVPRIMDLAPDLVVVAYAQNDEAPLRDGPPPYVLPPPGLAVRSAEASELWKLLRHLATVKPGGIERALKQTIERPHLAPENVDPRGCPSRDIRASDYRRALDEIVVAFADRGVDAILLYNNVPDALSHCTRLAQEAVAADRNLPLVDGSAVLAAGARTMATQAEVRLALVAPPPSVVAAAEKVTLVFRVDMSSEPKGRGAYVMGNSTPLGRLTPNVVRLYDDGTHGDQRPQDRIWSLAVAMRPTAINLVYLFTDGDAPGAWRGLENYVSRTIAIREADVGRVVLLPIEDFGRRWLRSDAAHPDAEGYRLIARALANTVESRSLFRQFVSRTS
jgi:lysophospholipase L1-like esterase